MTHDVIAELTFELRLDTLIKLTKPIIQWQDMLERGIVLSCPDLS